MIAAKDNGVHYVGVAAGATVEAVKTADSGTLSSPAIVIAGLDYVELHGDPLNDVINYSGGFDSPSQALDDKVLAMADLGFHFSLAAGNIQADASLNSPERVNHPNVFTISSHNTNDYFAESFSNFGNPPIDFAAHGANVTQVLSKTGGIETNKSYDGNSYAAPIVSGLLLLSGGTAPFSDGTVNGDVDGTPDPIAYMALNPPQVIHSVQNGNPKLDWNSIFGATHYEIYRNIDGGSWSLYATVSNTVTDYIDTNTYYPELEAVSNPPFNFENTIGYKVKAVDTTTGRSNESHIKYFVTGECTGPGCGS